MTPKILKETVLHEGWARFLMLELGLPDGAKIKRELDDHGQAACVLPYDPDRKTATLVRLWRVGALYRGETAHLLEAPAGIIDEGEETQAAARREALEETGLRLQVLEPVARAWTAPGITTETIALYLAPISAADRVARGGGLAEEHEEIEVVEMPLDELWRMVNAGELDDLKTLALAYALHDRRPDLFQA